MTARVATSHQHHPYHRKCQGGVKVIQDGVKVSLFAA